MRAVIFDGERLGVDMDRAEPDVAATRGEAVVRPLLAGICSTDLEICKGYMGFTGVLGHEFVGMVERVNGEDRRRLAGKRVVGAINAVCGSCDLCRAGLTTHCRNRTVLGISGRDGCMADRFVLPEANLVAVPDQVDDEAAVFAEPLAAALQACRQLHLEGQPYITVLGDGRLGLLCAQAMSRLNASVRVVGKHEAKMNLCEKWGIKHRHVSEIGRRQDQDVVVDCTGSADGLALALELVRPRGKVLLKTTVAPGGYAGGGSLDLSPVVINEIDVIGSRCGSIADAVKMLAGRVPTVDVISLISRRYRLEDAEQAFALAGQPEAIKVLIDMR
ncbi:MAG: alcohol dehydrogenase [Planctomycetes bacterium]|nr:alcohol dehydrogenase [Planctomycetota bacterium]NOG55382.1 alcohol dehydrogenase catalytic domain-containing protein [Planctomycetota bacterium]